MKTPYDEKGLGSTIDLPNFLSCNVMHTNDNTTSRVTADKKFLRTSCGLPVD